jgi:4-hydroxy-2-oxoheptanedioate aldolase
MTLRAMLRSRQAAFGAFIRVAAPPLVELCAHCGFDFVVIDAEHGPIAEREVEDLVRAGDAAGMPVVVRVPENSPSTILRYMDTGACGVQVPGIASAEMASAAVRAVKYPPVGARGLSSVRASGYGQRTSLDEYVKWANQETLVVVQIESIEGVRSAAAISKVEGVDVVFVGPVDLSCSLGFPGVTDAPEVQSAILSVMREVQGTGIPLGTIAADAPTARARIQEGFRYIMIGADQLLAQATKEYLRRARNGDRREA